MKQRLRVMLPPLAGLDTDTPVAWALIDRRGRVLRSGRHSLERLPGIMGLRRIEAILHPGDAVVTEVALPPLPSRHLDAAVQARVEPLALSPLTELCVIHGGRDADGNVPVAWIDRERLLSAWRLLAGLGFDVTAIVPFEHVVPHGDAGSALPLDLPADGRWLAPCPAWSFARAEWLPARPSQRWRSALRWTAMAAVIWIGGLHLYAAQLRTEARSMEARIRETVRSAFPEITVILDPVRQARAQVELMRGKGTAGAGTDDFIPMLQAAARLLAFASGHVELLNYEDGRLTLTLTEGYAPPTDDALLARHAASEGLVLEKDAVRPDVWHVARMKAGSIAEARR